MPETVNTNITVRVVAVGGKFIGDKVGGAAVSVTNASTGDILASGVVKGDSGPDENTPGSNPPGAVMCVAVMRSGLAGPGQIPTTQTTASITLPVPLDAPTRVQVTAVGPQAHASSANSVSATTWMYPGVNIDGNNAFLLELPGLICEIESPADNATNVPVPVPIKINLAMMCGCPINDKSIAANQACSKLPLNQQPWQPTDFAAFAIVTQSGQPPATVKLTYDYKAAVTGLFTGVLEKTSSGQSFTMDVYAQQLSTNNMGYASSSFST